MEKKITVLAIDEQVSVFFENELKNIFDDFFIIDYRNLDMEPIPPIYDTDLILYTDPEILNKLVNIIKCEAPTLMMKRTITRDALKKIKNIPEGKKALVTNINQYMANETMALIYQLGITDIHFYPFYEGKENYPQDVEYIIVPESEAYDFLPSGLEAEIILIGNRVFDISNVVDILSILRVDNIESEKIIKKYMLKVPTFWYGFEYGWENRRVLLNQWQLLLDELSGGVIISDAQHHIELLNDKAKNILKLPSEKLIGKSISNIIKNRKLKDIILSKADKNDKLVNHQGKDLVVTIKNIKIDSNFHGKIIIVNPYREMVEVQQKIHKKIVGKGYNTEYNFSDLIGEDAALKRAQEIGKKVAASKSTVLLQGESGTGKEILAGAIHNYSPCHDRPFVAINCATLPENLLESELFGYEEGAFTGARKNGKIGLFERADGGTLFLDEIGDLPIDLQARLLRAIEQKEIIRVGGSSVITVDVRLIAASNKDLLASIKDGKFREDLFYRLNVFQIKLPSLADRKADIPLLIEHFLVSWDSKREFTRDFEIFYSNYDWPGNVRELKNVLEYMITISDDVLSFSELPSYLKKKEYYVNKKHKGQNLLLKLLYRLEKQGDNTGRRSLTSAFNKLYYKISEMEIRDLIKELENKKYIVIRKGRAGNKITDKGIYFLKNKGFVNI